MPSNQRLKCHNNSKKSGKSESTRHNRSVGIFALCRARHKRKTCNTMMKNAGVSAEAAMQVLGHPSFKVNQKYYTGVLTEQQKRAINSIPSVG